jgi:hypothetical protein
VNDQLFFREKLERAIALHIDRVPKIAVSGWKYGNDDALFMIVGRLFNLLAYRKFGHRELLSESNGAIIPPNWLTHLNLTGLGSSASLEGSTQIPGRLAIVISHYKIKRILPKKPGIQCGPS